MVSGLIGVYFLIAVGVYYTWIALSYVYYRYGRQDEFVQVLAMAVESEAPLDGTLRAYLLDRPHGTEREFWVATLLFFVFPGYYWAWHRRHSFDRKVARVADLLERGMSLHQALHKAPGVVAPETELAAAVGETSGNLALCLREAASARLTPVWFEAMPRLAYPLLLIFFLTGILTFWGTFIWPKLQRIFTDFHAPVPWATGGVGFLADWYAEFGPIIALIILVFMSLVVLWTVSPSLRWRVPVANRLYRMTVRSRLLKSLALLLYAGKPIPEALGILADARFFKGIVRRRIQAAHVQVEEGEPLAETLVRDQLLPGAMAPLVHAAERARNLPWALSELGDHLGTRAGRLVQRISLAFMPIAVVAIGALVGFIVIGMFLPIVALIADLANQ